MSGSSMGSPAPASPPGPQGSGAPGPQRPGASGAQKAVKGFLPICTIASFIFTPVALIIAVIAVGGDKGGHFGLAMALFPYTAVGLMAFHPLAAARLPWFVLAFVQYPVYGLVIDLCLWKRRFRPLWILLALHLALAILCLSGLMALPAVAS
ncbi:MAG: hypothetical protein ACREJ2_15960 [Planctomycetota bacterium]